MLFTLEPRRDALRGVFQPLNRRKFTLNALNGSIWFFSKRKILTLSCRHPYLGQLGPVLPFATIDRGQTELLRFKWAVKQPLKGFLASFLRPNANHLINREDEDYSVANLSGASRTKDRVHSPMEPSVRNRNFKFHFGHESAV